MERKYYIEVFDIDQEDTKILNDIANRKFTLAEIKKQYDKTRIDRILKGLKELDLLKEVGEKKNVKGRVIKIYKVYFGKEKMQDSLFYSGKRKRFFKVNETPLF